MSQSDPPHDDLRPVIAGGGWGLALGVFLVSAIILGWCVSPTVGYKDSGLFSLAAATGGIPHPPGAPTWCLVATPWAALLSLFGITAAYATNLLSALLGALTLGAVALLCFRLARRCFPDLAPWQSRLAAVASAAFLGVSSAFVDVAIVAEQYTLLDFLLVAMLLLAERVSRADAGLILPAMLGLVWGLAVGNHLSQVAYGAAFVGLVLMRPTQRWRALGLFALGTAAGLLVFGWVLLRSRAEPVLDWGNVESFKRLLWALERRQWATRPLSEAPPGFVLTWLRSYNLQDLGWAFLVLLPAGVWALARKRPAVLAFGGVLLFPYMVGMFLAHMRQAGMDGDYIRHYGVGDFHQPVYILAAIAMGCGAALLLDQARGWSAAARGAMAFGVGLVLLESALRLGGELASVQASRGDRPAYLKALMDFPDDAIVILASDDVAFPVGYECLAERRSPAYVAWGNPLIGRRINDALRHGKSWDRASSIAYITDVLGDPERNPLRVPPPTADRLQSSPILTEFYGEHSVAASYLLPHGFLFQVMDRPTTDTQVLEADSAWLAREKAMPQPGTPATASWDGRCWSELYERRATFFASRHLWPQAAREYGKAVAWLPTRARLHMAHGEMLERCGSTAEADAEYRAAYHLDPELPFVLYFMALAEARAGRLREAEQLLVRDLNNRGAHPDARALLENIRRDLGATR